jgi:hypothetical protein
MNVTGYIGLPLAWKVGLVDSKIEVNKSGCDLKLEISDLRDCLIPELTMEIKKNGPRRQFDYTFVRGDLKDLPIEHMQAILQFCREKMLPLLERCFTKEDVKVIAAKANFLTVFEQYKKKMGWEDLFSPYDLDNLGKVSQLSHGGYNMRKCRCKGKTADGSHRTCCHIVRMAKKGFHQL